MRVAGDFHSFWSGVIAPVACSGKACVSVGVVEPLSSDPMQSPAHSLVPRTVPTSLQPIGSFGFTWTRGLLPSFGGALWANAVVEKQIATRMNNDLIVNLPFASRPPTAPGSSLIAYWISPFRSFENLHRASRRASPNCVPSNGTKEM